MEARAYRVSLHFPLHCHLLPYHHLFLHYRVLMNHGLAFCCENAGVGALRRQRLDRLDRFGSPDICIGQSDVQPGVSRRGRQENNGNQEKLAHRGLHLMMATASPIQVRNYVIWVTPSAAPREMSVYSRGTCCAAQQELAEAARLFDLSEHWFHYLPRRVNTLTAASLRWTWIR